MSEAQVLEASHLGRTAASLLEATRIGWTGLASLIISLLSKLDELTKGHEKVAGFGSLLLGSQLYYLNKYSYWSRRNVKTPTPLPFAGNGLSHLLHSYHHLSREWSKKYGKVYGYYHGSTPYLVVADAAVLRQICIKDFDKFTNRHFTDMPTDFNKQFLLLKEDDEWRSLRHILSPTFTSSKMKMMYRIFESSVNKLLEQLDSELDKQRGAAADVDIRASAGQISMGSTIGSLYGIELSHSDDPNDPNTVQNFSRKSHEAFMPPLLGLFLEKVVPHSVLRALNIPNLRENRVAALQFFKQKAKGIINNRLKSGERHNDYLQILIEARAEQVELEEQPEDQSLTAHHALDGALDRQAAKSAAKSRLSEAEIICQTVMFLLVATETTAGLIANTVYLMSFNKRIQQRLYDELAGVRSFDQTGRAQFQYDDVSSHQYLDCVISESLRLMPPALYLDRKSGTDYHLADYKFTIPRGTPVQLDFYGIMTDPDYWPEPERFDPERFSPENKGNIVPGSYCPFGIGPRHCIGYRFALTEAKLAIAKLVSELEFDVAPGAKFPPEPRRPVFIGNEYTSLRALVKRRTSSQ